LVGGQSLLGDHVSHKDNEEFIGHTGGGFAKFLCLFDPVVTGEVG
jgi:hypothetical protein